MKTYTESEVTVSLNDADVERLLEEGSLSEEGVTIEYFGSYKCLADQ